MAVQTVTWTTDVPGTSWVEYGPTTSYGSNSGLIDPALVTSHTVVLTVSVSGTYHYRVHSRNVGGTDTASPDATFTIGGTGKTVTWTTDVPGTSWVEYGPTTSYGSSSGLIDPALVTNHTVALTVSAAGSYHYRAHSRNVGGTDSFSADGTFTIAGAGLTSVAPATVVVGGGPVTLTFTGAGTAWLSGVPTITAGAGSLGVLTAITNTSVRATFTPPVAVGTVTFTDVTEGGSATLNILAAPVLTAISPTSAVIGSGPLSIAFAGFGTTWLSGGLPTITVSVGSLGVITATSDTSAHATFTPPVAIRSVIFTDATDSNTTATFNVVAGAILVSVSPNSLLVGGGATTLTFTGAGTTWQSIGVPTITVSSGSLGAITATTDTSAHATFTPPLVASNVTFTDTTDGNTTVVLSVSAALVIPTQVPGMGPALVVEVAFTTNPSDPPQWTDITRYVQGTLAINRGRQRELDQIQAGTMALELDNRDRRFDPTYTGSPYWPNVRPMRRVRARATYNNSNYPLYTGYVESWGQGWSGWQDATVPITAADAFKPLNLAQLNTSFPPETSDQRINEVLSNIGWTIGGLAWRLGVSLLGVDTIVGPTGDRVISSGSSTIQASTLANTSALQHMQDVTTTEMGLLFTDRDGAVTFRGRGTIVNQVSAGTFGEGVGEMPYVNVEMLYDDTNVWNDVEITRVGGVQQSAADATSQAQYYKRTLSNTSTLHNSDVEALSLANALVGKFAQPSLQISAITLDGWANPANVFPQMLGREIGDLVTVMRRPPGGGQPIAQPSVIQGIALSYAVTGGDWSVTWRLAPTDTLQYWKLNDPVLSLLGNGAIPGSGTTRLFF